MVNNLSGKKTLPGFDPKGGKLSDGPDNAGGYMETGSAGRKVPLSKGEGQGSVSKGIDPKGGQLLEGPDNPGGRMWSGGKLKD
jgi:hypothetical protein